MRIALSAATALALGCLAAPPSRAQDEPAQLSGPASPGTAAGAAVQSPAAAEPALGPIIARRASEIGARASAREDIAAIAAHYAANPDKPLWIGADGLTARAAQVIDEIRRAEEWGLDGSDFTVPSKNTPAERAQLVEADARLSLAVLKYARHARGGRLDPVQLSDSLDRQPQLRDPRAVLDGIAAATDPADYLRKLHPQHPQFERLRKLYVELRTGTALRLAAEPQGKMPTAMPAPAAAAPAEEPKGKGKSRSKEAKAPSPALTAERVKINMEMWRWMPEDLGRFYVTVNIPEFTLRVVKNGQPVHTERVITGEPDKQTPILTQDMQSVVFHPGWGVPNSIKVKELLPGLVNGRDTLTRSGLRATYKGRVVDPSSIDWRTTDIRHLDVVQPPGPSNVLGVVKFQFPNRHDVYMHDTPTKHLFNSEVRAFSHGCMRVRNPVRLAEILFAEDQGWTPEKVAGLVKGGPMDNRVMLSRKVPVHITYFTVIVDDDGKPTVLRDIYQHESKVQLGLEGKASQIVKKKENLSEARAQVVSRATSNGFGGPANFFNTLFGGF